jgi:hypothetical protein
MDWGDYDNDGDLDLLVTGDSSATGAAGASHTLVYQNNGGTQFTKTDYGLVKVRSGSAKWGDYNNDGDLDILISGYVSSGVYTSKIYRNTAVTHNTPPTNPSLYPATVSGDTIIFKWFPGTDNQTPIKGLTYNLRVGTSPGACDIVSPMSMNNGYRKIPAMGNTNMDTTWRIQVESNGTYYWNVQTIDQIYKGSVFSDEQSITVSDPSLNDPPYIISPIRDTLVSEEFGKIFIGILTHVFADSEMATLSFSATALDGGVNTLISNDSLYIISRPDIYGLNRVKVTAGDGLATGSDTFNVSISAVNDPPNSFSLLLPLNEDTLYARPDSILFRWNKSFDVDMDPLTYSFYFTGPGFDTLINNIIDTSIYFYDVNRLPANSIFEWYVQVTDGFVFVSSNDTFNLYSGDLIYIENNQSSIPGIFILHQNYPNPFNPATTIKYDLAKSDKVSLKIYNLLGQEVRTLVNHNEAAGFKSVVWNGKNNNGKAVSSGIYFYRLETGSFVKTMKMLLVR